MNKIHLSLLYSLLCLFIFNSCGKDEQFQAEGKWNLTEFSTSGCADAEFENVTFNQTDDGLCFERDGQKACVDICLTLNADGTALFETTYALDAGGFVLSDRDELSGTWMLEGDILTLCEDMECDAINIAQSDNKIVITDFDDDLECSVSLTLEKQQ